MPNLSILDELVFMPGNMRFDRPLRDSNTLDYTQEIPVGPSQRRMRLGVPWFFRYLTTSRVKHNWGGLCAILRRQQIPLFCSSKHLKPLNASILPVWFAKRSTSDPFHMEELDNADGFEIECQSRSNGSWAWPVEIGSVERVPGFIRSVRKASNGNIPIGMGLPIWASSVDLSVVMDADIDFLTISDDKFTKHSGDPVLVDGVVRARAAAVAAGRPDLPIIVISDVSQTDHLLKLLALGASCVSIDSAMERVLSECLREIHGTKDGLLSGMGLAIIEEEAWVAVDRALNSLRKDLEHCLNLIHAKKLSDFNSWVLRGLTPRACQLANVKALGE